VLWNRIDLIAVLVPAPTLEKLWFRHRLRKNLFLVLASVPDQDKIKGSIQKIVRVQNLAFSMSPAALFPRKLASHFGFFEFFIPFYVRSGSKSGS
jgi:hypothetical protein